MARTIDQHHRTQLAAGVADYFVASGTVRVSLRDLSADVGASARMLVHHFGTREQLVDAALDIARERQITAATAAIVPGPDAIAVLRDTWTWFRRADTQRFFVLFTDVAAFERSSPARDRRFSGRLGTEWRPLFERVFAADGRYASEAPQLALLVIGVLRGFSLDLVDGADASGHEAAFRTLVEVLNQRKR